MQPRIARILAIGALVALLLAGGTSPLSSSAQAEVLFAGTGWQWGNPRPQGNTLDAISFAGTTGYAAGFSGTLLKTTDGGQTWVRLQGSDVAHLSTSLGTFVQAFGTRDVVVGWACTLERSSDGGATFMRVRIPGAAINNGCAIAQASFVSPLLGYIVTRGGTLLTTSDGGRHFTTRTPIPEASADKQEADDEIENEDDDSSSSEALGYVHALTFTSAQTGVAATRKELYRTTDGGTSWHQTFFSGAPSASPDLLGVTFTDPAHGYAVGGAVGDSAGDGLLVRTDDGGATWTRKPLGVGQTAGFFGIACAGPELCLLSTISDGALVRTTDGGQTARDVPNTFGTFLAAFSSPTHAVTLGVDGAAAISDDAGATFRALGARLPGRGRYRVLRAGALRGSAFALGNAGAIAATRDGGHTWQTSHAPTASSLVDASFPSASSGVVLDARGRLLRTTNSGTAWRRLRAHGGIRALALYARTLHDLLLVGPRDVRRSGDGGRSFRRVRDRAVTGKRLAGIALARGATVVAWGRSTLARSSNDGTTWRPLRRPAGTRLVDAAFASATTGFVVMRPHDPDSPNSLWRTTSGGRRWKRVPLIGPATHVALRSLHDVYVTTSGDSEFEDIGVLHSRDGGASWVPEIVDPDVHVVAGAGADYLLAGGSDLLFTTSGGVAGHSRLALTTARRRLTHDQRIVVRGRLAPAQPGTTIEIVGETPSRVVLEFPTVKADGSFSFRTGVQRGTNSFTAAWLGGPRATGAVSRPLSVVVRR